MDKDTEKTPQERINELIVKMNMVPELRRGKAGIKNADLIRDELDKKHQEEKEELERELESLVEQPVKENKERTGVNIDLKPIINPENAPQLFEILKGYFDKSQHNELEHILSTGESLDKGKLVFKGNANRLTYTFKQLIEHNLISGCEKKDLEKWLINNFQSLNKGKPTDLNQGTTHKSISGQQYHCKTPIIKIIDGQPQRFG